MSRNQMILWCALVFPLLAGGDARAQSTWPGVDPLGLDRPTALAPDEIQIKADRKLTLPELTAAELLGAGTPAIDAGAAYVTLGAGYVGSAGDPTSSLVVTDAVTRIADFIFSATLRDIEPTDIQVLYELVAPSGQTGRFEHEDDESSYLEAIATPIGPVVVDVKKNQTEIEAGCRFDLDLTHATIAGDYLGELVVVINSL